MGIIYPAMYRILFSICLAFVLAPLHGQESLKEMRSNVKEVMGGKEYYIHTVKKGQSLYMISKAYNTEVNTIINENPQVKDGLKAGMKLLIPVPGGKQQPVQKVPTPEPRKIPEKEAVTPEQPEPLPCEKIRPDPKAIYRVALMIPLYLGEVSSIGMEHPNPGEEPAEYRSLRFVEFYEGFLMAVDSLQKTNLAVKLYVYDVPKDTLKTKSVLKKEEMKSMDLIIGLVYSHNFRIISDFAKAQDIPLVSPLSEREEIVAGNPQVFKVLPGQNSQPDDLSGFLAAHYSGANIVVVKGDNKFNSPVAELEKACEDRHLQLKSATDYSGVASLLSKENENVIILYSDERVFALELVTKLNELRLDYNITLVGMPGWDDLDDELEAEYLVNLKTKVMAPWFIDYTDPDTKKFVKVFQDKYFTDPDHLAFQGFDVANYFLSALHIFGKDFYHCIPGFRMKSLQTDFEFTSSGINGFENSHWVIYSYDNYRKVKEN